MEHLRRVDYDSLVLAQVEKLQPPHARLSLIQRSRATTYTTATYSGLSGSATPFTPSNNQGSGTFREAEDVSYDSNIMLFADGDDIVVCDPFARAVRWTCWVCLGTFDEALKAEDHFQLSHQDVQEKANTTTTQLTPAENHISHTSR